jgi:hypothetical protein
MGGKIERLNGAGLFKELLFIRPNVLGLHPTLNLKKNVNFFLVFVFLSHHTTFQVVINNSCEIKWQAKASS